MSYVSMFLSPVEVFECAKKCFNGGYCKSEFDIEKCKLVYIIFSVYIYIY